MNEPIVITQTTSMRGRYPSADFTPENVIAEVTTAIEGGDEND